ncbi:MAG: dihydroorotate dehydrogenase electron transfer subunit [Clostridia bacterium]|nr:dihydroorotate dehydrogenase electron transfer subunit [Clostridia bacterium]
MNYEITENRALTASVHSMRLRGDTGSLTRPGQFVQVALPDFYLRRPISVCEWDRESLRLVYKVVGQGTAAMAEMKPGACLDLLPGLGNGFDTGACGEKPLLVGGGVGLPPLLGLCRALLAQGKKPLVLAGFGTAAEAFLLEDFRALGVPVTVTTMDGSLGLRGLVTDALGDLDYDDVLACGPLPMLKALWRCTGGRGQYSLEERMGCGFGACMGCSVQTAAGSMRVCKEGPVFRGEVLPWA